MWKNKNISVVQTADGKVRVFVSGLERDWKKALKLLLNKCQVDDGGEKDVVVVKSMTEEQADAVYYLLSRDNFGKHFKYFNMKRE